MKKFRPRIERLESRELLYATMTGLTASNVWAHKELITYSVAPDGTNLGWGTNSLNATLSGITNANFDIDAAFANWGSNIGVNFVRVSDDGAAFGADTVTQGASGHGDIRIGGYNFGTTTVQGYAWNPPGLLGTSLSGDIFLNTGAPLVHGAGAGYDLFTVMEHEIGHSLGLEHSTDTNAVMYSTIPYGARKSINADDITGAQTLYPVTYDAYGPTSPTIVIPITPGPYHIARPAYPTSVFSGYTEYFYVAGNGGADKLSNDLTITVNSGNLSQLTPVVSVKDAAGTVVASGQSSLITGDAVVLTIHDASSSYYIISVSGRGGYTAAGAYALSASWGQATTHNDITPSTNPSFSVPYWGTNTVTWSIVPDGTLYSGTPSSLNSAYSSVVLGGANPYTNYIDNIYAAFNYWGAKYNINFVRVADDGSAEGVSGLEQSDPRFGDIRIFGYDLSGSFYGATLLPQQLGTADGDIALDTVDLKLASSAFYGIITHEIGHALGLEHDTTDNLGVMYPYCCSNINDLDITPAVDSYMSAYYPWVNDAYEPNNVSTSPAVLSTPANYTRFDNLNISYISSTTDVDYYWVHPSTTASNTAVFTVQSSGLSSMAPWIQVWKGGVLIASASALGDDDASVVINNVSNSTAANNGYVIRIGKIGDQYGSYALTVDWGATKPNTYTVGSGSVPTTPYRALEEPDADTSVMDSINEELIAFAISLALDELDTSENAPIVPVGELVTVDIPINVIEWAQ